MSFRKTTMTIALVGLLGSAPVLADETWTWGFATGTAGCVANCGSGDSNATPTKTFQSTGSGGTVQQVVTSAWSNTASSGTALATADITRWDGGLGVRNAGEGSTSPNHAVDNSGYFDLVMFDFGTKSVALSEVSLGWYSNDTDISVLAYTGAGAPVLSGVTYNASAEALTGAGGWSLIGNYDVRAIDPSNPYTAPINAGGTKSRYWIVAAYNPQFSSAGCTGGGACGTGAKDYFKIAGLSGSYKPPGGGETPVPVPSPLALGILGLAALTLRRRMVA